jgi:hypothetical protein
MATKSSELSRAERKLRLRSPCEEPTIAACDKSFRYLEGLMKYTSERVEATKAKIVDSEQRIGRQRRRVEKLLVDRHPADEAQAQLLIMEQSLLAMTRYLKLLVADLEAGDLSLQKRITHKRIHGAAAKRSPEKPIRNQDADPAEDVAADFAELAVKVVLQEEAEAPVLTVLADKKAR